jgi:hypothetical protein
MGWFGRPSKDDESLIEISNDSGDHWVAQVPTNEVRKIEKELSKAGCERDEDDSLRYRYNAKEVIDSRDKEQYRFKSDRIIDEGEDYEDTHDQEMEASDYEPDECTAWRWWK